MTMDNATMRTELIRLENLIKKQGKEILALRTDIFTHTHESNKPMNKWATEANGDNEAEGKI